MLYRKARQSLGVSDSEWLGTQCPTKAFVLKTILSFFLRHLISGEEGDDPFEATRKRIEKLKADGSLADPPRDPPSIPISGTLIDPPAQGNILLTQCGCSSTISAQNFQPAILQH